jgi:glycosyltransferase involved in cell wall biosynthesis
MNMNRIHFHSDCSFFAGCENMLVNFFHNENLKNNFDVSFSYRFSSIYETGYRKRVNTPIRSVPMNLFDRENIDKFAGKFSSVLMRRLIKLVSNLLLLKYIFILWNTVVLFRFFRKESIDLLHINNGGYPGAYSCMSAVLAAKLSGVKKIVYVVNNIAVPYTSIKRWVDHPLDRLVAKTVSVFITGSVYTGQKLKQVLGLTPSQIKNIHNGIAPRSLTEDRDEVLDRLNIKDERVILGVVAILEERKGHIYLLKSLKLLKQQGYSDRMPIVLIEGGGPLLQSLKKFVVDNDLNNDVLFIGNEQNVFNLLNAVDVIILPSISNEDFPNVVLEAMSLGKTVIASRLAGIPEQIEHMKTGILVKPKDADELADAMAQILNDKLLCKSMGKKALSKFNQEFLARISVQKYVRLYTRLLEGDNK